MEKPIIEVKNLSKFFKVPTEKRDSLQSYFVNPFHRPQNRKFKALDDVSFEVYKGDFLGVMGRNGSGKSTLLKIISGVYAPSKGKVVVNGSLIPFLSLGVGFNPQLTGRENIYLNGTIMGLTRKEVSRKFDSIVDFAELEDFIDLQVKNYSSGMVVRLGFSIAMQVRADIFILDEVMAVGDSAFKKKSLAKMQELLAEGSTVVFVSHSDDQIRNYCNKVVLLEQGRSIFQGGVTKGITEYKALLNERQRERNKDGEEESNYKYPLKLLEIKLFDKAGKPREEFKYGEEYKLKLKFKAIVDTENPKVAVNISNQPEMLLYGFNTNLKNPMPSLKKGEIIELAIKDEFKLKQGEYTIRVKSGKAEDRFKVIPWYTKEIDFNILRGKILLFNYFNTKGNITYKKTS